MFSFNDTFLFCYGFPEKRCPEAKFTPGHLAMAFIHLLYYRHREIISETEGMIPAIIFARE